MASDSVKWVKSPSHREKIARALKGNLNALKTGKYVKRDAPASTCACCPMDSRCPRYRKGGACVIVWEKMERMARKLGLQ